VKILVYRGKHGDSYWLARDAYERERAFTAMFTMLDEWGFYVELPAGERELYAYAKAGNPQASYKLLVLHQHYEYEGWSLETVVVP